MPCAWGEASGSKGWEGDSCFQFRLVTGWLTVWMNSSDPLYTHTHTYTPTTHTNTEKHVVSGHQGIWRLLDCKECVESHLYNRIFESKRVFINHTARMELYMRFGAVWERFCVAWERQMIQQNLCVDVSAAALMNLTWRSCAPSSRTVFFL